MGETPRRRLHLLVPGDPETLTGGYAYGRRIAAALRARGWGVETHTLYASFPRPTQAALAHAEETLAALPADALVLVDGLAYGAMPRLAGDAAARLRLLALVHHPLAAESGLDGSVQRALRESEREALAAARGVVVTSRATAHALADYDVPASRVAVVEPGTDPAPLARGSQGAGLHLVCVATLTPRKGHLTLLDALATLADRDWRLTCAGSAERDPDCARAVRERARDLGERVRLLGELDAPALAALYDGADAFVLATRMEGYGMALAEALARGLPVVATRVGAVPDTVPQDAGMLVPPDDPGALAAAIASLLDDPRLHARLAAGARRARATLPRWEDAASRLAAALARLAG